MIYSTWRLVPCVLGLLLTFNFPGAAWAQTSADGAGQPAAGVNAPARNVGLANFLSTMLDQHPRLHAAGFTLDAAREDESAAGRAIYNPKFVVEAENAVDKTRAIGFDQAIDWGGQRGATRQVAAGMRLAAEAQYLNVRQDIAAEIFALLSDYWIAAEALELVDFRVDLMRDFAEQSQRRQAAGDLTRVESNLAVIGFAQARMHKAKAQAGMAHIKRELARLNAPADSRSWPRMPDSLPVLNYSPQDVDQLTSQVPEVRAARAVAEAGEANVELVKSLRKPDPTFGLRVGEEANESLVAINFSIPVFVRNNYSANVLAAMAERSTARSEAVNIEAHVRARLLFSMEKYGLMRGAWSDWEKTGEISINRQLSTLKQLWEAQELSMSEFILQTGASVEVQDTALELRAELWRSWIEWLNAANLVTVWLGIDEADRQAAVAQKRSY
jgi:cobalt-zinc-cadmium efflux system outer membrane protein